MLLKSFWERRINMAKERRNTVSLFDSMGKNKEVATKVVNIDKVDEAGSTGSQQRRRASNEDKTEVFEEEGSANKKEILTEKDIDNDENVVNNSIITADIEEAEEEETGRENTFEDAEEELNESREMAVGESHVKRRGRRRLNEEKDLQHIHIALPTDVYEKLEIGKKAYYNNKTTYIRNLILDDYERNKDYYERLPNIR
jgi:hypothetical protein